ncbi:MAG: DUF6468 domain-containing protein [Alphaproteobacteria bacterium]|nr:DUF6468 domain-containing protein [Alphaproteobacteria bacterium]
MMLLIDFIINISVAVLLLAVIVYCKKLSRNIRVLQDSKSDMAKLFAQFDESIEAAQKSVSELKDATKTSEESLQKKLDTANGIADDLAFMIERGNKTADQIETGLKHGRDSTAPSDVRPKSAATTSTVQKTQQSPPVAPQRVSTPTAVKPAANISPANPFGTESDKPGKPPISGHKIPPRKEQSNASRTASLESVLEQMANRNNPANKPGENKTSSRIRSKAEQELFDSLKSSR